jgi:predicted phosphohydrolase
LDIFAVSDLHLPGAGGKPMDLFGAHWENHFHKIADDWLKRVSPEDVVLLPGDLSWAMRLDEAKGDIEAIGGLPGLKIILRGNHDYWWNSISKVRRALPPGMMALQNDCVFARESVLIAGTRGWILPGVDTDRGNARIYERELMRLEMSLSAARRRSPDKPLIVMMHYPPIFDPGRETGFTRLIERYDCRHVVYGHLHGSFVQCAFTGILNGVSYYPVSCDGLGFALFRLPYT